MFISVIAIIIVIAIVIFSHELGHFLMAKRMGVRVEVFSLGFGPKLWSTRKGDTEYKICLMPLGGYVKMAGEEPGEERTGAEWEFHSKPVGKRFNIVVTGALVNYILGTMLFCAVFMASPLLSSSIGGLKEGYPAQEAGLKKDDRITEINGWGTKHWLDVLRVLAISSENTIITVERDGEKFEFDVRAREEEMEGPGGKPIKRRIIGIFSSDELLKYGFFESIAMGIRETLLITRFTFVTIWKLLTGTLSVKLVAGPIGIFAMTGQAARVGLIPLLALIALINISLAIINLLPLPPLDGGHILFLGIEKLRGRPIDTKVQEIAQGAGWILLLTLLLVVSWNDIITFF